MTKYKGMVCQTYWCAKGGRSNKEHQKRGLPGCKYFFQIARCKGRDANGNEKECWVILRMSPHSDEVAHNHPDTVDNGAKPKFHFPDKQMLSFKTLLNVMKKHPKMKPKACDDVFKGVCKEIGIDSTWSPHYINNAFRVCVGQGEEKSNRECR